VIFFAPINSIIDERVRQLIDDGNKQSNKK
jgi:hypothetical protein